MMTVNEIMKLLPHRYPFLLVDKIVDLKPGESALGVKNVTINEPFFQGHFPGQPIMPGVLVIEAMAQVAGVMAFRSGVEGKSVFFMSIDNAKFRRPIVPGDQVMMEIKVLKQRGNVWKFSGTATVDGKLVSEAEFTAMVTDREI
ncbi:MAG: 3-hydroxyacyl-ACP dehydratase FabZ [Nitrospiraceae bacterium]|jgi:3-hydroxyacyl-[acyl-carrier-protein] dehydratase|nr:3-hydroxyacyl-ACP dehydratase FabZ [Nitrospiraceae bacterium]